MIQKTEIFYRIKDTVNKTDPEATVIVYGSFARGDNDPNSDIDLLILLDKDVVTREDEKKIKYPLYDIEFDTGRIISPIVLSKSDWDNKHRITPFYENVTNDGVLL
jgi:predicted nucleotidyltransferase